jgi:hypothetical protein
MHYLWASDQLLVHQISAPDLMDRLCQLARVSPLKSDAFRVAWTLAIVMSPDRPGSGDGKLRTGRETWPTGWARLVITILNWMTRTHTIPLWLSRPCGKSRCHASRAAPGRDFEAWVSPAGEA